MRWRRLTHVLHRDIGYIAAGLTIIYAFSGIAINHIQDWNPIYKIEKSTVVLDSIPSNLTKDEVVHYVLNSVGETRVVKNTYRASPNELEIFVDGNTILVDYNTREVHQEKFYTRFLLKKFMDLHLNKPKGIWTYLADLFAISLLFLAISGLFMIKGKNGIKGRGAWLTLAGILIPVIFWLFYYL
ncbi:MAG: PepSY-associated TM helix domain-containing protein [Lutibacter sp.]|jgi:hypothetical protein